MGNFCSMNPVTSNLVKHHLFHWRKLHWKRLVWPNEKGFEVYILVVLEPTQDNAPYKLEAHSEYEYVPLPIAPGLPKRLQSVQKTKTLDQATTDKISVVPDGAPEEWKGFDFVLLHKPEPPSK